MPFLNDSHCNNQTLGITAKSSLVGANHGPHSGSIHLESQEMPAVKGSVGWRKLEQDLAVATWKDRRSSPQEHSMTSAQL